MLRQPFGCFCCRGGGIANYSEDVIETFKPESHYDTVQPVDSTSETNFILIKFVQVVQYRNSLKNKLACSSQFKLSKSYHAINYSVPRHDRHIT
jgi:hypothetical protein